jgi:hypothetical protein
MTTDDGWIEWAPEGREMKARDRQGVYFWLFACPKRCAYWLTAPTRDGDPNWIKACAYGCGPLRRV